MNSLKILEHELSFSLKLEIIKVLLSIYYSMRKEMSRNDKTYSDKEPDHWSRNPENLRSSYWNHQRKNTARKTEDAKKRTAADTVVVGTVARLFS